MKVDEQSTLPSLDPTGAVVSNDSCSDDESGTTDSDFPDIVLPEDKRTVMYNREALLTLSCNALTSNAPDDVFETLREFDIAGSSRHAYSSDLAFQLVSMKGRQILPLLQALFKINPSMITFQASLTGSILSHAAMVSEDIDLLKFLLEIDSGAVRVVSMSTGLLPLQELVSRRHFSGQLEMLHELIEADPTTLEIADSNGNTALHHACLSDAGSAVISLLLRHYAAVARVVNREGEIPLHCLCKRLFLPSNAPLVAEMAAVLLNSDKSTARVIDAAGEYALHLAAKTGSLALIKTIYEAYPEAVRITAPSGSPLRQLLRSQDYEGNNLGAVAFLCTAYPEAAQERDRLARTLLHKVVGKGLPLLRLIHQAYPEAIKARDWLGWVPLHLLFSHEVMFDSRNPSHLEELTYLLKHYPGGAAVGKHEDDTPYALYSLPAQRASCSYVKRLLLYAVPHYKPKERHQLNYTQRRGALYLLTIAGYSGSHNTMHFAPPYTTPHTSRMKLKIHHREKDAGTVTELPTTAKSLLEVWRLLKKSGNRELQRAVVSFL
jgi:ankyrin repeat protein